MRFLFATNRIPSTDVDLCCSVGCPLCGGFIAVSSWWINGARIYDWIDGTCSLCRIQVSASLLEACAGNETYRRILKSRSPHIAGVGGIVDVRMRTETQSLREQVTALQHTLWMELNA